tara:strand:- start:1380 stop:1706 length:327 start_codon:yes stop_codon:yes gene_type:complete
MMNDRPILFLMLLWISVLVLLQGCAAPSFLVGSSATATASGSYQTYKTITIAKTGVDIAQTLNGEKTTTDHIISKVTGKDCKVMRAVEEENLTFFCVDTIPEHLQSRD